MNALMPTRTVVVRLTLLCACIGTAVSMIPVPNKPDASKFESAVKQEVSLEFTAEQRF
jgi:hypothetical protein